MMTRSERERWLLKYVKDHQGGDVLNRWFVEAYVKATGAKSQCMILGADSCPMLGRDLARLAKEGKLERRRCGLGQNWQSGFPKWVWVYRVPKGWDP